MVNPFLVRRTRDEHGAMIAALKRGDRAGLVRLCVRHTQPAQEVYLSMQAGPDAATDRRVAPREATAMTKPAAKSARPGAGAARRVPSRAARK